jgi:hypothetical protein
VTVNDFITSSLHNLTCSGSHRTIIRGTLIHPGNHYYKRCSIVNYTSIHLKCFQCTYFQHNFQISGRLLWSRNIEIYIYCAWGHAVA